jgi:lysozyme family protein
MPSRIVPGDPVGIGPETLAAAEKFDARNLVNNLADRQAALGPGDLTRFLRRITPGTRPRT